MTIEQAIFTSAETAQGDGYRLVAASAGLSADEAHELSAWGPSHDSLLDSGPSATSVNFHRLASGRYAVSKTSHAGSEYSGRGGMRVYTQFLILAPDDLARFANNPFAVLRAAAAQGRMQPLERIPPKLEALRLSGKSPAVDHSLLTDALGALGVDQLVALVDAAISNEQLLLIGGRERQQWIAALLNCLPVECRSEFSFSTGLKPSPRRPFRIISMAADSPEARRIARSQGAGVFPTNESTRTANSAWARYLRQILSTGKTHALASQLALERSELKLAGLDALGETLLGVSEAEPDSSPRSEPEFYPRIARVAGDERPANTVAVAPRREHRPTDVGGPAVGLLPEQRHGSLVRTIHEMTMNVEHSAAAIEALELLDDTVFAAIAGSDTALARLKKLWPKTLAELGELELAESREHYVRRALAAWRQTHPGEADADLGRAQAAIEVVCTLYGE